MKLSADFIARRSHNHRRDNPQISPITQIKVWVPTRGFSIRPRLAGFLAGIINCAKSIEFVSVFEIYVICEICGYFHVRDLRIAILDLE
jgi:hypothetical protein